MLKSSMIVHRMQSGEHKKRLSKINTPKQRYYPTRVSAYNARFYMTFITRYVGICS